MGMGERYKKGRLKILRYISRGYCFIRFLQLGLWYFEIFF